MRSDMDGEERHCEAQGWRVTARSARMSGEEERERLHASLDTPSLPEMVFGGSTVELRHVHTGVVLRFCASDALCDVHDVDVPKVRAAERWMETHRDDPHAVLAQSYDWTYTTSYRGTLVQPTGPSSRQAWRWRPTTRRIDRTELLRRDPIRFYDELVLYESELDDHGASQLAVKLRVMPRCAYVLLRHWLRVDGVLVRLRDTRTYVDLANGRPDEVVALREHTRHEASALQLQDMGMSIDGKAFRSAEATAQALEATSPASVVLLEAEELVAGVGEDAASA